MSDDRFQPFEEREIHNLFYANTVVRDTVRLDPGETRHAVAALRLETGDELPVTDGSGTVFLCRLDGIRDQRARATILARKRMEPPAPELRVMLGLPEKKAFESALKGLAALGVRAAVPIICKHCQKKWWKLKWEKYNERFTRTIIAASKQSLNPHFMHLFPPTNLAQVLTGIDTERESIFYGDKEGGRLHQYLPSRPERPVTAFIGPPGGFSPDELFELKKSSARPLRLGPFRQRTELAALTLTGIIMHHAEGGSLKISSTSDDIE